MPVARRGNCYVASEALYHLLGGKRAGWTPVRTSMGRDTHWWLRHKSGLILDVTKSQFRGHVEPIYETGRGAGFLTKRPSRRARKLMKELVWQQT
jgi:hypothetical protein